jgi:hypothetical protein
VRVDFEFEYILPSKLDWLEHIPCRSLCGAVADAYAGFIPADSALKQLSGLPGAEAYDARFLRGIAHGYESFEADASVRSARKSELDEAASIAIKLNAEWDGACRAVDEEGKETKYYFFSAEEPTVFASRLHRFFWERRDAGEPRLEYSLSGGRVAGELVIMAAAALVQLDRALASYVARDIDAFANFLGDTYEPIHEIDRLLTAESRSRVARSNARKSHSQRPNSRAMEQVHREFIRWDSGQVTYKNDSDFARRMLKLFPGELTNETSIKNNCTKWRRAKKSAS